MELGLFVGLHGGSLVPTLAIIRAPSFAYEVILFPPHLACSSTATKLASDRHLESMTYFLVCYFTSML